jgi:hypothetical protein
VLGRCNGHGLRRKHEINICEQKSLEIALAWVRRSVRVSVGFGPFCWPGAPAKPNPAASGSSAAGPRGFDTSQQAAASIVDAAEKFEEPALEGIFGPDGYDIVRPVSFHKTGNGLPYRRVGLRPSFRRGPLAVS